ncbi:MAG: GNAT family N-acetyltransferase [Spirochaetales bacterium]|nr:GNAT family N-acetyltransferase [Spirochaetales bacterium]
MFIEIKTKEQIEQVSRLARSIWIPYFSSMINPDTLVSIFEEVQSVNAISEYIKNGYLYYFIHSDKEALPEPVGYFAYHHRPEESELFLSKLYLIPSARRCGHGERVMSFLAETARKNKCTSITLIVFGKNEGAEKAYRKMGFRRTKTIKQDSGSGHIIIDYAMKKDIPRK